MITYRNPLSLSHRDASNKSLSLKFEDYVYNIEVEDFHTYYVGYAGVLVKEKYQPSSG